jgi:hypothetical protein
LTVSVSREEVIRYFRRTYEEEYDALGAEGVGAILDRGRSWQLDEVIRRGGAVVFPHVHIADCGPYVAAAVHACLDSGADRILAIGVLHASSDEMNDAKVRVSTGQTQAEDEPLRRVYGPGLENGSVRWERDHGLYGFRRLLADEVDRRGIKAPELIERYPYLTGEHPESLPGMDELVGITGDAAVVSTADHCHHGIGYGHTRREALYFDESGLARIRRIIEDGLSLLDGGRIREYLAHCQDVAKSDWRDAPMKSTVLEIVPSDFSKSIYNAPAPTWCAGALVTAEQA